MGPWNDTKCSGNPVYSQVVSTYMRALKRKRPGPTSVSQLEYNTLCTLLEENVKAYNNDDGNSSNIFLMKNVTANY